MCLVAIQKRRREMEIRQEEGNENDHFSLMVLCLIQFIISIRNIEEILFIICITLH